MNLKEIDELIATEILGWEIADMPEILIYGNETVYRTDRGYQISSSDFQPSKNIKDAWQVAEKLGLALIPQSDGEDFRWFVCDIDHVGYRGDEIAIIPIEDTEYSQDTAPLAICASALMTVGIDINEVS